MHGRSAVPLVVFIFLSGLPFGATQNASLPAHQARQSGIRIRVPTKLRIERTPGEVKVEIDRDSLESVKLTIEEGMVTGIKAELRVYPVGESRPAMADSVGIKSGIDFDLDVDFLNAGEPGFPVPNKKYTIEMALTFFETDVHPGHMWQPWDSTRYKALWQRTLVGSVE